MSAAGRRSAASRILIGLWVALALATFLLGITGYLEAVRTSEAVYDTLKLLAFQSYVAPPASPPWQLEVARFTALVLASTVLLATARALFRDGWDRLRSRLMSGHVIVVGLGDDEGGAALVRSLRDEGQSVVAVAERPALAGGIAARSAGAAVVVGDATDPDVLVVAGLARAYLVALHSEVERNVEVLAAASEEQKAPRDLLVLGETPSLRLAQTLREHALTAPSPVSVDWYSPEENAAQMVTARHLVGGDERARLPLVLVGYGDCAEALLIEVARRVEGDRRAVTVISEDAGQSVEDWQQRWPLLASRLDIEPLDLDVVNREQPVFTSARDRLQQGGAVVVGDLGFADALRLALTIRSGIASIGVLVIALIPSAGSLSLSVSVPGLIMVDPMAVGRMSELVLNHLFAVLARAIHEDYVTKGRVLAGDAPNLPTMRAWEELDDDTRRANEDQARELAASLKAAGYRISRAAGDAPVGVLPPADVEVLATGEHKRWCAERRRAGWQPGARDDARRRHPDLVSWDELPEPSKERNRQIVNRWPRLLDRLGYRLWKLPRADAST